MKIEITCRDDKNLKIKIEVYALVFTPESRQFSMPYCEGDDWYSSMNCPVTAIPEMLQVQWDRLWVVYKHGEDARAFSAWLVESEQKAQHSYKTMRG